MAMNPKLWKTRSKSGLRLIPIVSMATPHIRNAIRFLTGPQSLKTKFQQEQLMELKKELLRRHELISTMSAEAEKEDREHESQLHFPW